MKKILMIVVVAMLAISFIYAEVNATTEPSRVPGVCGNITKTIGDGSQQAPWEGPITIIYHHWCHDDIAHNFTETFNHCVNGYYESEFCPSASTYTSVTVIAGDTQYSTTVPYGYNRPVIANIIVDRVK